MKKRIFIIDDEPGMIRIATDLLEKNGYAVGSAVHPKQGMEKVYSNPPDLLLLDVGLPDKDGFEICREMKADPKVNHVPIIILSVKSDETDVVMGLELGADDYISKPYRSHELLARVKTALRKKGTLAQAERLTSGPFLVDFRSHEASINGHVLKLTPKEFDLLAFFIRNEGRVLTKSTVNEAIWGVDLRGASRAVDTHVTRLKKKLKSHADAIQVLWGVGYRFDHE